MSVQDVQGWVEDMGDRGQANKTVNARLSALSGFYRFLQAAADEHRLPINMPNPTGRDFVARLEDQNSKPTTRLTLNQAKRLLQMPDTSTELGARDHAILGTFLYVGPRLGTVARLKVEDFHDDPEDPTLSIHEKGRGRSRRRVGIHFVCAESIRHYLELAGIDRGPLFRAQLNSRSKRVGQRSTSEAALYRLVLSYLERLPQALVTREDGSNICRHSPHSLRRTTATLLHEVGVPIERIQELLGHKDIRVTRGYIKSSADTRKSASHDISL